MWVRPTFWLLLSALALFAFAGACTAYTYQYSATCTSGGCQDVWLVWIFIAPPAALVGIVVAIVALVLWLKQRRSHQ